MRKYTSEHIGKLIRKRLDKNDLLVAVKEQKMLEEKWKTIPDSRLRAIKIDMHISDERAFVIQCRSNMALQYVRRQKNLITNHFQSLFEELEIVGVEVTLSRERS